MGQTARRGCIGACGNARYQGSASKAFRFQSSKNGYHQQYRHERHHKPTIHVPSRPRCSTTNVHSSSNSTTWQLLQHHHARPACHYVNKVALFLGSLAVAGVAAGCLFGAASLSNFLSMASFRSSAVRAFCCWGECALVMVSFWFRPKSR